MNNSECQAAQTKWYQPVGWLIKRKLHPVTSWIAWKLYQKVSHCDSPEYFSLHPKLVRWTGGLKVFTWTHVCGHGLGFSLHMGNIYWRIFKWK